MQKAEAFKKLGIDINGKTEYELLDELAKKWNELTYPWYKRLWWYVKDVFRL